MASQVSPGVVIRERDLTNSTIVNSQALRGAIVAAFEKGPVDQVVAINSQKELVDTFGIPNDSIAQDWFVASEFLNYGGRLAVARAVDTGALNASTGTGVLVKNETEWDGTGDTFVARTAGSWGNSLSVVAVDRGFDQIVTLASTPATTSDGTTLTFVSGKTAKLYDWDGVTNTGNVVLQGTSGLITSSDLLDIPDTGVIAAIDTFTGTGAPGSNDRTAGTFTNVDATGGGSGAKFTVVITALGEVTVTLTSGGTGYSDNQVLTISSTQLTAIGAGSVTFQVNGIVNTTIVVSSAVDWYRNTSVTAGAFSIKLSQIGPRPGTSAQGANLGFSRDEFHIAVIDVSTGVVLESLQYLSKLDGGKTPEGANTYYKTVINQVAENIFVGDFASSDIVSGTGDDWTGGLTVTAQTSGGALALFAGGFYTDDLASGNDASFAYSSEDYEIFRAFDEFDIDFILMGGSMPSAAETLAKANKVVDIASARKDCVAFISPDITAQVGTSGTPLTATQQKENTIEFFNGIQSTSYAVFDSGYKYLYDRFNDKFRYVPCNGDVAGLCVSTSAQLADWYSPAGLNRGSLRNAVKLAYNPNQSDRDELYQARINPIVSLRGSGITLFGDKTGLSSPSAFDRINVRRLFLNVERRVDALAQGVLFEQNDTATRTGFSSAVTSYLAEIKADRGLTDFLVVCDESNNTPSVIDRNEFVADIYLQPTRSINFVTITLTATRTGVSFEEVVGR
jgi:hypothetical protein